MQLRTTIHLRTAPALALVLALGLATATTGEARAEASKDADVRRTTRRGLEWLASRQTARGYWAEKGGRYPAAMTAMAGMALLCEGSTTTQGRYAENIRRAVDYLVSQRKSNGLIGDPVRDNRYTYGHGLQHAVSLTGPRGGRRRATPERTHRRSYPRRHLLRPGPNEGRWVGDTSAPATETGSTRGRRRSLRFKASAGCRNAGIPVPSEIVEKAVQYIKDCTLPDGGVQYNSKGGGGRPPITAAALACLFNAGEYDNEYVPKLLDYSKKNLWNLGNGGFGHWHYAHYYYSQVLYREGGATWEEYRDRICARLIKDVQPDGSWTQASIGPVYSTSINLTILQLDNATLPIYQR